MKNRFALVILLILVPAVLMAQGYYNQENFGNRSLLLSGTVTGSVDDLGLTYYNPARIALIEDPIFSINAKAYQFSTLSLNNVFGVDSKLSDSKFEGVPSLLAGTFKLGKSEKHKFAYAFLSKQRNELSIDASNERTEGDFIDSLEDVDRLASNLQLINKVTDEWFGLTWGTKLKENFSIGVSTFVSVYNFKGEYDLRLAELEESQDVNFYNNAVEFGQTSYGIFWKVGLAWKLKKIDIGLNVDLPYLELVTSGKFSYAEFLSGFGNGDDIYDFGQLKDLDSKRKQPLGISFGAGIPWKKNRIHLKADWHGAISEYDRLVIPVIDDGTGEPEEFVFKEELKSVLNFGVGAEFFLSERINLFASFTTDFTPVISSANIFDLVGDPDRDINISADYFHYGLGFDLKFNSVNITIGGTYSSATTDFDRPVDFPDPDPDPGPPVLNEDPSSISFSRYRVIVGLEFPIFGYNVNFK
ncbi:MAG: hypothetical protein WBV45_04125 [Lutimonas sp.]